MTWEKMEFPQHTALAFFNAALGAICCSLCCIIGELPLERMKYHDPDPDVQLTTIHDYLRVCAVGAVIVNFLAYAGVVVLGKICHETQEDTARNDSNVSVVGDFLLFSWAYYICNMLASVWVGHSILNAGEHKIATSLNKTMESLAVGMAASILLSCCWLPVMSCFPLFAAYRGFFVKAPIPIAPLSESRPLLQSEERVVEIPVVVLYYQV